MDDNSWKPWVMLLNQKGEAAGRFKEWKGLVVLERGVEFQRRRTDNGGVFTSNYKTTNLLKKLTTFFS